MAAWRPRGTTRALACWALVAGLGGCDSPDGRARALASAPDAAGAAGTPSAGATGASGTSGSAGGGASGTFSWQPPPPANAIQLENLQPGSDEYLLTQPATAQEVEGYASQVSAVAGEHVRLHVNVTTASGVRWQLYRVGHYQGHGARLLAQGDSASIEPQAPCPVDPVTGVIECSWPAAFELEIAAGWLSGYYLFKLIRDDGLSSYVPLIVREAAPRSPLLMQASVDTWQAYNLWGGTSLYANHLPSPRVFTPGRAVRVSFDRPYLQGNGAGQMELAEGTMVRWLERRGYDVSYTTNIDVSSDPERLLMRKMFLSVGHDEYWPVAERDALEVARERGVSLGFFSANTGYWRVRLDPASSGTARRIITCYKGGADPETDPREVTAQYRDDPAARPENALLGVMFEHDVGASLDAFPFRVKDPGHWLFDGTGVRAGERISNVIGHEWDHVFDNGLTPAGLEIVGDSPAITGNAFVSPSNATVYYPSPTSLVFAAGAIYWAWGLGKPDYSDTRIQRITDNVLSRGGVPSPLRPTVVTAVTNKDVPSATRLSLIAGSGEPGDLDGPAAEARFDTPAGVAAAADGALYVTEARNHRVRKIAPDGQVSTLAGCGPSASAHGSNPSDGRGAAACLNVPTGIALRADGMLFVSDTGNHRIVSITPQGDVSTFATASYPRGLAFGPDGRLYVADSKANAVLAFDPSGASTTLATGFNEPTGVALGSDGTLYVVTTADGSIWQLASGALSVLVNQSQLNGDRIGAALDARLRPAEGVLLDGGALIFSDTANYRVRALSLDQAQVSTLAGDGNGGLELGAGAFAELAVPRGLTPYHGGYAVADSGNNRIVWIER